MNTNAPTNEAIAAMLARMHSEAASSQAQHGDYASSASHDQLSAKYRDIAETQPPQQEAR